MLFLLQYTLVFQNTTPVLICGEGRNGKQPRSKAETCKGVLIFNHIHGSQEKQTKCTNVSHGSHSSESLSSGAIQTLYLTDF